MRVYLAREWERDIFDEAGLDCREYVCVSLVRYINKSGRLTNGVSSLQVGNCIFRRSRRWQSYLSFRWRYDWKPARARRRPTSCPKQAKHGRNQPTNQPTDGNLLTYLHRALINVANQTRLFTWFKTYNNHNIRHSFRSEFGYEKPRCFLYL